MRIFLAGATGIVGRRLVPLLLAQGHQVTGLSRTAQDAAKLRAQGAEAAVADVFDAAALAEAVRVAAPEVVLHQLTALGAGDREANARVREVGTRNLVDAALAAGTRRIVAQSIAWAYRPGSDPAVEQEPLDLGAEPPRLMTVAGVAALEEAVRELLEWVVVRYGSLYGPGTWYAPDGLIASQARAGELVPDGDVSSFLHVDDAAGAAVAALSWPTGAVNICDDEPAAAREWLPVFCHAVGAPAPAAEDGAAEGGAAGGGQVGEGRNGWARGADNRYARDTLGWAPAHPSWRSGFSAI